MKLEDFKNIYSNKPNKLAFLIGGAPSLFFQDLNITKNYITMAINSGIVGVPWANYYTSDDIGSSSWSYHKNLKDLNCTCFLYKDKLKNKAEHIKEDRKVFFDHTWWYSPENNEYNLAGLKLNRSDNKVIGARTSFASGLHLLFLMGFSFVVLLGNDCRCDKNGKRYFWEYYSKNKQPYRIKGIEFNERTKLLGFDSKSFIDYWRHFSENNKEILQNEFKIINCSDTPPEFNFFEKMSIEEVLEKYGDKK